MVECGRLQSAVSRAVAVLGDRVQRIELAGEPEGDSFVLPNMDLNHRDPAVAVRVQQPLHPGHVCPRKRVGHKPLFRGICRLVPLREDAGFGVVGGLVEIWCLHEICLLRVDDLIVDLNASVLDKDLDRRDSHEWAWTWLGIGIGRGPRVIRVSGE